MANQLFMYAAAYDLAQHKNTSYCLSDVKKLKYFKLSPFERIINPLKYSWFRIQNTTVKNYRFFHYQNNFTNYKTEMKNCPQNSWFYGYFQNAEYFSDSKQAIKQLFQIKKKYQYTFNQFIQQVPLDKKIIAVHIRRSDYLYLNLEELNGPDLSLPVSYYFSVLEPYIDDKRYQIIFISDEIEKVKQDFMTIKKAIFSENNAIVDFQIIKYAHVAILANSTFSWWAAWLNERPDKKIIAPKYFMGFKVKKEYPVNIIPSDWEQRTVL